MIEILSNFLYGSFRTLDLQEYFHLLTSVHKRIREIYLNSDIKIHLNFNIFLWSIMF
jgi:hypothetical protein